MKGINILVLAFLIITATVILAYSSDPMNQMAKNAYKQILQNADRNHDGKISLAECKALFKDNATGQKNCGFWDANHDGIITEDEYISQAMSFQGKK